MEYRCGYCNLDFPDIYDYLHHECKFYSGQYVMQVCNGFSMFSKAFNLFKSSNEGHTGSIYQNEKDRSMLTDISLKAVSQIRDFLKHNENQSFKETLNENPALEQSLNNIEHCNQVQIFTHEKVPDFNLSQPSTSYGARQISENFAQRSSIPPSV
ncbi:hypothetical protein TNIN_113311 [Trichonephila inaurata madagascariensis]|uniref:Uncharacterized protein n=1 Tax=Trichonephila inaurata madagascariensis TaxID=2747483 RepID=A0A8X6ML44_9ARAC|nr:hypothetical protein TNIN_113311 [Trichonephila inaurata madagascariensis]